MKLLGGMNNNSFFYQSAEPWVIYRALLDLDRLDENNPKSRKARKLMMSHPLVSGIIQELHQWPGNVLSSHKSAGQLYHKLAFIADLGLTEKDDDIKEILVKVIKHQSEEGLFLLPTNIPVHFGGTGEENWAWALCDAPLLLYSVTKMSQKDNIAALKGFNYLLSLVKENGWPCKVSKELGKFRGPGKKEDPCPYVNLLMLKLIALFSEYKESREAHIGVECLLNAWEKSKDMHPYMFFMGTDFRKLKAPFIWYDILHVAEVLSQFDFALKDQRFLDMLKVIHSKADSDGLYTPESVWKPWEGWDFGQKKKPSAWLTFLVFRIDHRLLNNSIH